MDCEVSERGIDSLRREYDTLINAGLGQTHEWLDTEDEILKKCPLLPRENIKVSNNYFKTMSLYMAQETKSHVFVSHRVGRLCSVMMGAGWLQLRQ